MHGLFINQVIAKNANLAAYEAEVKQALERIRDYDAQKPEEEILED